MKSLTWNKEDVFKMDITTKIFLTIDTKELNWCYLFNVTDRKKNSNRNGSRIIKIISFCFAKVYYHTILYIGEFRCHTDIWILWHQEGWVVRKLNEFVVTIDNAFKFWDKTRNNVGPKPEPCTKPRLNDSNLKTVPLRRQTCWRADRNDPIVYYLPTRKL